MLAGDDRSATPLQAVRPARVGLWRTPAWRHAEAATVRAVETAAQQLARNGVVVDEIALPAEFERFLDAQSDVLRFEAARVFAFERTRRADLLSPSSRDELAAGAAIPRRRYLEAQALLARCRALFAAAIAPFDVLLDGERARRGAYARHTGDAMFNRWRSGLLVPCVNLPGFTGPNGLPVGVQLIGASTTTLACCARPSGSRRTSAKCTESEVPKIKERMKSGVRQGARPPAYPWYGEAEQRSMAPNFAANYRVNF